MRVYEVGSIKSINLPDSFARGDFLHGGMGNNWKKSFYPRDKRDHDEVAITSMFRGTATLDPDARNFRKLLDEPARVVYSKQIEENSKSAQAAISIVNSMAEALGNAGNNQLTNCEMGIGGPRFNLQKMETLMLNDKKVLAVSGFFHNSEMKVQTYYLGLFVDARPNNQECIIEEIAFEATTEELYEKYRNSFEKSLHTIEWNWN